MELLVYETSSLSSAFRSKIRVNSIFSLHLNYGKTHHQRTIRISQSKGIPLHRCQDDDTSTPGRSRIRLTSLDIRPPGSDHGEVMALPR